MFHGPLFKFAHILGDYRFLSMYKALAKSQWYPYSDLKSDQEVKLQKMISFSYENVPYYHKLFKSLNLSPEDIKTIEDLEKLPVLNKEIIKENWDDFKPVNLNNMKYYTQSTGGSTGTPFQYRLSKHDRFLSGAMLYRGWGYGGYELGDKMVFMAGSSLDVGANSLIIKKAHEITRNIRKLSSFDMSNEDMHNYASTIRTFNPKSIRGYASSINLFASFVKDNNIDLPDMSAIYTTAEKLLPHMRDNIGNAFDCDVYDAYGLSDGGVGAYECSEHNGLHIDTERSIMEIVDENGKQITNGVGNILATSLHNYAMPFIRYDTGDMGHIIEDKCGCGRESKLLIEVLGRQQDMLKTPEGTCVHGAFFNSYMFGKINGVSEFQVIQKSLEKIIIKLVVDESFDQKQLDSISSIVKNKSKRWNVEFKIVNQIKRTKAGKYKYIISEI